MVVCPPTPEWKRSSEFDLNGEAVPDDDDDGVPGPDLHVWIIYMRNFDILGFSIFSCWMNLGRAPLLWHCFRVTNMLFDVLVCFEGLGRNKETKNLVSACCLLFGLYGWSWIAVCFKNPLALDFFWLRVLLEASLWLLSWLFQGGYNFWYIVQPCYILYLFFLFFLLRMSSHPCSCTFLFL